MKKEDQNRSGEYEKSYGGSSYNKDERSHYTIRKEETAPPKAKREETVPPKARKEETIPPRDAGSVSEETPEGRKPSTRNSSWPGCSSSFCRMSSPVSWTMIPWMRMCNRRRPWTIPGVGKTRRWKRMTKRPSMMMTMKQIPRQHEWRGICFRDNKGCEGMFRDIKGRARRRPLMDGTGTGVALATPHTGRRAWGRGGCETEGWP